MTPDRFDRLYGPRCPGVIAVQYRRHPDHQLYTRLGEWPEHQEAQPMVTEIVTTFSPRAVIEGIELNLARAVQDRLGWRECARRGLPFCVEV